MRAFPSVLAVALSSIVLGGEAIAQTGPPETELHTPDRANTSSVRNAAVAPLKDLNIMRQGIPPILLQAISNPYDPPRPLSCRVVTAQVRALTAALGADFDEPDTPQAPSLTQKSGRVALAVIHGAAETLLPFAGFVRTLSGAQRHDQLVIEAITAGSVRRGYLKGLGEAIRCRPPAVPLHPLQPRPPVSEDGRTPRYPIR